MQEPKTKCSELWFAHAWENTTPNEVLMSNPPIYPDKRETCKNCWLTRIYRVETTIEYKL